MDMEIMRVTEEWQRAGVHFVRAHGMIREFGVTLDKEFADDTPESRYVLALDGNYPVATCRLHYLEEGVGKIERVVTVGEYRGKGYGAAVVLEAENWMKENGVRKVYISARIPAIGFYEKLGYSPDYSNRSGEGLFECVMTEKKLED